jgi:hypothetical protein
MTASPLAAMLGRFQKLVSAVKTEDATDAELLQHFQRDRDQEAFAALVWRHGPLVWRVCKRVVGAEDGAEDAFQATFLVLSRKAGTIKKPLALAGFATQFGNPALDAPTPDLDSPPGARAGKVTR